MTFFAIYARRTVLFASYMQQPGRSPESVAFREAYADLCDGIESPLMLITALYSKGVLGRTKREALEGESNQAAQRIKLVAAVEAQVNQKPRTFHIFLELLGKEGVMEHLCSVLTSSLGEHYNACILM